jgi:hypothetical protein
MMKSLLRAALLALLPFCMIGSVVVTAPAAAAEKPDAPKISKSISKLVDAIQKANTAKDWPTVIAKCKEAQAVPDLTDYDRYIIDRFLGIAYINMGDHVSATVSVAAAITNPAIPPEDRKLLLRPGLALENEAGNYPKVLELGNLAIQDGIADDTVYGEMSAASFNLKDYPRAMDYAKKSIELATTAGKLPVYTVYQVLVISQDQTKDRKSAIKTLEAMANLYGKPDDWANLLDFSMESLPPGNKAAAALSFYRLRLTVGAKSEGPDYLAMVDAAQFLRSPGDVKRAVEAALASGALSQAKGTPLLNRANAEARQDELILTQVEKAAAKSPSAKEDAALAESYFGYGRYADVVRVAQRAIGKGGAGAIEARLLLGLAQAMTGDDAAAAQTLDSVTGDGALQRAAQIWKLYVTRKYGRTPAAAPTGQ